MEEWDDLSFAAIEIGSVVVISTLGCKRDIVFFMRGYNEMIRRIEPSLIIFRAVRPRPLGLGLTAHFLTCINLNIVVS